MCSRYYIAIEGHNVLIPAATCIIICTIVTTGDAVVYVGIKAALCMV